MDDIILSIYVATYNHENYIARALDSILMQKTNYKFEVLVGEDCSTDSTREILKEYEKKYPGFFTMFYRKKNMYNSECNNQRDLRQRCKGKYIIGLEGDDFWTDENKLQKQVDFLEENPEYIAVAHNTVVVGEDSEPNGETYPECKDEEYTIKHFFSEIMPGQLTTVICHNYMIDDNFDTTIVNKGLIPGDRLLYFALLCHGKIYCMQEIMSAYRHITTHGSSFSATFRFDFKKHKVWQKELIEYAKKHSSKKTVKIAEYQLLCIIIKALFQRQLTLLQAFREFLKIKYKISTIIIGFKRIINKKILHKKLYA
ncbi:MAG: glycosyltransferase [Clostridia bacterium]|nr:glycosyltransferase [Clostridia bacterium]